MNKEITRKIERQTANFMYKKIDKYVLHVGFVYRGRGR